jgi:2-oxoglutarate ferredoxin oxidoreductase subunit alpha
MPQNTGELLAGFDQVLVPEMNNGQLVKVLRAEYLTPAQALNKVNGQPFKISEIEDAIKGCLDGQSGEAK